jgi:SAM-dependent methyltransferase
MVLVTPALRVKLYVPLALPALRMRMLLGGRPTIKSYVRPRMLTHDARQAERYGDDPLISRNIATNVLLDLHDTSTRLLADAGAITTPTMVLSAGSDWVVKNSAQRRFFDRLSSPRKVLKEYPGFYHAILHEQERHKPIADVRGFVNGLFDDPPERPSLLEADRTGYTHGEYEAMKRPLPAWSPKRWNFAMQRLGLKTACRLSDGVRLGWRTGFDSGESLDYVYRDRAKGITGPLGKLIDRIYLNAIGWRGVRVRKAHLQELLRLAIGRVVDSGQPARVLDIAAGAGRYTLEVLREFQGRDVSALLRDRSPGALEVARNLAAEMGLAGVGFAEGDAFSRDSLARVTPRPNIAIVSGLYELFGNNDMAAQSLRGLADALPEGGYLIYTNQPWHPQLEMIARVLVNREQKPWIMRRRTQAEMDELVRVAGFEKIDMRIDRWGIFTVSLARRVGQ